TAPLSCPTILLVCTSGPDAGKRVAVREDDAVVGRASSASVLSDDPDVTDRHAIIRLKDGQVQVEAVGTAPVFVDGHRIETAPVGREQMIRIGRSLWRVQANGRGIADWIDDLGGHISTVVGVERVKGFSFRDTFSEVFKSRTDEEIEEYFNVGTRSTTPPLEKIDTSWPRPWVFFKLFTMSALAYLLFVYALNEFGNPLLIPGLITVGSFLIPFSILVLFFEANVARNVPLYQVIRLVLLGGILSLILSLFLFRATHLDSWLGAASAGIVEEIGKASALLLVINKLKYRWTLNGLLFGAAVGTGFASFESAGYAFYYGLMQGGAGELERIIMDRGLFSMLGGHVLWTAMVGAALWKVRGDEPFRFDMIKHPSFVRVFFLAMILHMIWNLPFALPFYAKYVVLGFAAWVVILGFIQEGLAQIRREQQRACVAETVVVASSSLAV